MSNYLLLDPCLPDVQADKIRRAATDEIFHGVERVGGPDTSAPPSEVGMRLSWNGDEWMWAPDSRGPL